MTRVGVLTNIRRPLALIGAGVLGLFLPVGCGGGGGGGGGATGPAAPSVIFFSANDGTSGFELWKTDGTEAGTMRVKDINPGPGDGIL